MNIPIEIEWPNIPLPHCDFTGSTTNATISTPSDVGGTIVRSRFRKSYPTIGVKWNFLVSDYDAFLTFFQDTLGNGTACFKIDLRYPKNSELKSHIVRIANGVTSTAQDGTWLVEGQMEILGPSVSEMAGTALQETYDIQAGLVLQSLSAPLYSTVLDLDVALAASVMGSATIGQMDLIATTNQLLALKLL